MGSEKIRCADAFLGNQRTSQQTQGHAREADDQGTEGDLVNSIQGRQMTEDAADLLTFQASFLHQVEQTGQQAEEQQGIGHQQQRDMEKNPSVVHPLVGNRSMVGVGGG